MLKVEKFVRCEFGSRVWFGQTESAIINLLEVKWRWEINLRVGRWYSFLQGFDFANGISSFLCWYLSSKGMFDIDFLVVDSLRWRFRGIFFDIGFRQGFQPILSSLGFWIIIRKASLAAFHVNGHLLLNGNCSTSGVNQSSKCLNTKSFRNKNLILSAEAILQKCWHFDQNKS